MSTAGFYLVPECRLRFGKDGCWYANDEPIRNRRIAALFSRSLVREKDGNYVLRVGAETAPVTIEDTPFVVTSAQANEAGIIEIELSDGSTETLSPAGLQVGHDNVLYCIVKNGSERALFLRPAYYQLARYFVETESGRIALKAGTKVFPIESSRP